MTLQLSQEKCTVYENTKPEVEASGLSESPGTFDGEVDVSIVPGLANLCNRSLGMSQGFKAFPYSFFQSHIWEGARLKHRAFITELLYRCVWKKTNFISNGHTIELLPGQFAGSLRGIVDLFNPKGLKGKARSDCFSKNDVESAIQYFSNHAVLRQETRHQTTILTFIDKDIYESNFSFNQTAKPTVIRQYSDSHLKIPLNHLTNKNIGSKDPLARTDSRPPKKAPPDTLKYCFDKEAYEGISEKDLEDWKVAYPAVNISQEIAASVQWVKSNHSKVSGRKAWRRFLVGWLSRSNEKTVNRQAYSSQSSKPQIDRRQRNADGSVCNDYEGLF